VEAQISGTIVSGTVCKGRGKPRKTIEETIKKDLDQKSITCL